MGIYRLDVYNDMRSLHTAHGQKQREQRGNLGVDRVGVGQGKIMQTKVIYTSVIIKDSGRSHSSTRICVSLPTVAYDDVTLHFNLCSVKIPYYGTCLNTL